MARQNAQARLVRDMDAVGKEDAAITKLCNHTVLEHDVLVEVIRKAQEGCASSMDTAVRHNVKLVVSIARRHSWSGIPVEDLINEGAIGLMRAVERFDHRKGFKFATYATHWIRHFILRYIQDTGRLVRLPVHSQATLSKLLKAQKRLESRLGIMRPDVDMLMAEAGIDDTKDSRAKLQRLLLQASPGHSSLDAPVLDGEGGQTSRYGIIPIDEPSQLDAMLKNDRIKALRQALSQLDPRERAVIKRRFFDERTLVDIGTDPDFKVTRERIRQIEGDAKKNLRRLLLEKNIG